MLLNCQLVAVCKNVLHSCLPMCTPAQQNQPQPSQKNPHKSKENPTCFVEPTLDQEPILSKSLTERIAFISKGP
jgi:hypothetical protein